MHLRGDRALPAPGPHGAGLSAKGGGVPRPTRRTARRLGPAGPWDPGQITDDALAAAFKPAALTRARGEFQQGLLVELVRGAKPSARFHVPPHTVRFLVPGDIRYTHCDCAEEAPCRHVPPAVWAFRMLEPSATAGLVSTQQSALPVPPTLLDDLEGALQEWVEHGIFGRAARLGRPAGPAGGALPV